MTSIRLLPIVVFSVFALLVLKGVGLITQGGYIFAGTEYALAQGDGVGASTQLDQRAISAADRASEAVLSGSEPAPAEGAQPDALPVAINEAGEKVTIGSADGSPLTERAVLERLSERRAELDQLAADLDARSALVAAAEKRLAERIASLEAIESRINALVDEKKAMDKSQFANLVSMYETMKPKDAAAIFDTLASDVLLRIAKQMSARRMAPILAAMSTEKAKELTDMLAEVAPEPALDGPIENVDTLPQIVGQ